MFVHFYIKGNTTFKDIYYFLNIKNLQKVLNFGEVISYSLQ